MKNIALIGSTGSIGRQTLNVVRRHSDRYRIVSLAAGSNEALLKEQIKEFNPLVATIKKECADLPKGVEYFFGDDAFKKAIIKEADIVVVALVGFAGLSAVLTAIENGKDVALANKESLVVGGACVTEKADARGVKIIPVDSEHSAVWQVLGFDRKAEFKRIILTASGGAFRDLNVQALSRVTASEALLHPNWSMGKKITVDCATLVNKAFEVIEARWLYDTSFDKIDVIIHRESIIHSMVELEDSSVLAQMSYPTMEIPIQIALSYPQRLCSDVKPLDFAKIGKLSFEAVDNERFPCFGRVVEAGKIGGLYPAVANGANEKAVEWFLKGKIGYNDIYAAIDGALSAYSGGGGNTYEDMLAANTFGEDFVVKKFR